MPTHPKPHTRTHVTTGLLIQAHAPAATRLAPQEQTTQTLRVLCMEVR